MLPVGSFDPAGMARLPIYVARTACLDQVGHFPALAVDQTLGKILLERRPELRITILRELTQPHPSPLASAPQFVEGEDLAFVFIQFGLDFPALHLEDDTKHFDALPLALLDEFTVIDEAIEAKARVDRREGFLLEVRQRNRTAAHGCPYERCGAVIDQVVDHAQPAA